jgi:uncharacterized damage-inducible protein DinB
MHLRPEQQDYAAPFHTYIRLVPDGDLIEILSQQLAETRTLLASIPEDSGGFRYAEGKWSLRQVVGHVVDSERIFAYRALRIGRNDPTPLAGFDQDVLAASSPFDEIPLRDILHEFEAVRTASIFLLRGMQPEAWNRLGTSDGKPLTMRAIAFVIAGHELHHRDIIRTRYLPGIS